MALCRRRGTKPLSRKRLIGGGARHNIASISVPDKHRKYIADLYTTLLDIQWRWVISLFIGVFSVTWVLFASVYYLFASVHGDLAEVTNTTETASSETPCLVGVDTFTAAYLFSIETMTTIGYGSRYQTEECPGVYLAVMVQSIVGAALQVALASVVVSKIRRAKGYGRLFSILATTIITIRHETTRVV